MPLRSSRVSVCIGVQSGFRAEQATRCVTQGLRRQWHRGKLKLYCDVRDPILCGGDNFLAHGGLPFAGARGLYGRSIAFLFFLCVLLKKALG